MTEKTTAIISLESAPTRFMQKYADTLEEYTIPDTSTIQRMINDLPEDLQEKVAQIAQKLSGKRKGQFGEANTASITEVKLFQGTGNDPDKPDRQVPGEYYNTMKVNLGSSFVGTVIASVAGQSKWEKEGKIPECRSMDRVVGSKYGECSACPYRPWRDGQIQACQRDVLVYMIPETLDDVISVRFGKTSEAAGTRLRKLSGATLVPWAKWFKLTADEVIKADDKTKRYYKMQVEPTGEYVPTELSDFFDLICSLITTKYILPNTALIYQQAEDSEGDTEKSGDTPEIPAIPDLGVIPGSDEIPINEDL
jgi:hypothetical protein